MNKKISFIDAFSTLHVGNGALLDNSFKIANERWRPDRISIITSDVETNHGRYDHVIEDVFSNYPSGRVAKFAWAVGYFVNCVLFYLYEKLGIPERFWWLGVRFKKIAAAIKNSDIIISISGETINDHYAPQMYMRCLLFYICISLKKEFYIFPQSIGPIFRPVSRNILRVSLSKAKVIYARDIDSFKLANEIWGKAQVQVSYCPDVAVTQESVKDESHEIFRYGKRVIGITLSDVPNEISGSEGYLTRVVSTLTKNLNPNEYGILLMPSNYKKTGVSTDYEACMYGMREFRASGFDVAILENRPIHPDEYQGIQKSLFVFITSRMHVGILATSASVPTIMLNTQHKILGYMRNISMEDFVVEYDGIEDELPKTLRISCHKNLEIRERLREQNNRMRKSISNCLGVAASTAC